MVGFESFFFGSYPQRTAADLKAEYSICKGKNTVRKEIAKDGEYIKLQMPPAQAY